MPMSLQEQTAYQHRLLRKKMLFELKQTRKIVKYGKELEKELNKLIISGLDGTEPHWEMYVQLAEANYRTKVDRCIKRTIKHSKIIGEKMANVK